MDRDKRRFCRDPRPPASGAHSITREKEGTLGLALPYRLVSCQLSSVGIPPSLCRTIRRGLVFPALVHAGPPNFAVPVLPGHGSPIRQESRLGTGVCSECPRRFWN